MSFKKKSALIIALIFIFATVAGSFVPIGTKNAEAASKKCNFHNV